MRSLRVVAAVVTRDRRAVLRESLPAVIGQTRPPDRVVVVDNASSDGTREMLADEFPGALVVGLPTNQGATGGFHEAIGAGLGERADWLWLLDDDSFPRPTALAELIAVLERAAGLPPPALLCSRVDWSDGEPHPMNRPIILRRDPQLLADAVRSGLLPVRAATWVSLLISRDAVERAGMPLRHFFYQADDIEYTARILRDAPGYFVPRSVVEHSTPAKHTAVDDDHRFYYHTRNTMYLLQGDAWGAWEKPTLAWSFVRSAVKYLRANRLSPGSIRTLVGALFAGLRGPGGEGSTQGAPRGRNRA